MPSPRRGPLCSQVIPSFSAVSPVLDVKEKSLLPRPITAAAARSGGLALQPEPHPGDSPSTAAEATLYLLSPSQNLSVGPPPGHDAFLQMLKAADVSLQIIRGLLWGW
jgi:hypothetical protein